MDDTLNTQAKLTQMAHLAGNRMYDSYKVKFAQDLKRLSILSTESARFMSRPKDFACDEMQMLREDLFSTINRIVVFEEFSNAMCDIELQKKLIEVYMNFRKVERAEMLYCPRLVRE